MLAMPGAPRVKSFSGAANISDVLYEVTAAGKAAVLRDD
jgi:hypothetical protein